MTATLKEPFIDMSLVLNSVACTMLLLAVLTICWQSHGPVVLTLWCGASVGTPLQNDLMELWSLMHFLMPQVFSSHAQFKVRPRQSISVQQSSGDNSEHYQLSATINYQPSAELCSASNVAFGFKPGQAHCILCTAELHACMQSLISRAQDGPLDDSYTPLTAEGLFVTPQLARRCV